MVQATVPEIVSDYWAGSHLQRTGDTMAPSFFSSAKALSTSLRSAPRAFVTSPAETGFPASRMAAILRMLYAIFLLDLQSVQDRAIAHRIVSQCIEEIFICFIRLLPLHFAEHHDIAYYASQLHVSTVYLSSVVRQVSGRTVVDYVNQFLIMEASFLLRTTQLTIGQIADRLHFADTASFSKFFLRKKGVSPKAYREGNTDGSET